MIKRIALSGAFFVCIAGFAQAATVSGNFGGTISAPSSAPGIVATGVGTDSLAWGTPSYKSTDVETDNSSSLTVNKGPFEQTNFTAGKILFGTITWNNQSNWHTGGSWDSIVNLSIDFDAPTDLAALVLSFGFSLTNTPDDSYITKTNEDTGLNPDVISGLKLSVTPINFPISLGDGLRLTSVFFGLESAGNGSSFDMANGEWVNREGGTSTIGVYGNISAVPLPAGLWLLLGGLGGLAAVRRRAKEIV